MVDGHEENEVAIFWFRRDFRVEDNAALYRALMDSVPVQPIFIFDTNILSDLPRKDARVEFILDELNRLSNELRNRGAAIDARIGEPIKIWNTLLQDYKITRVYAARDYEPYARERDKAVYELLDNQGIKFIACKDQVVFEKDEILKKDGTPYTVYTPYSKQWKLKLNVGFLKSYPSEKIQNWNKSSSKDLPTLAALGFDQSGQTVPSRTILKDLIQDYHKNRDIPSISGTSRLGIHLRFGTISIRKLTRIALEINEKYLNELIWRDFYCSVLWHFPHVVGNNFREKYDGIEWRNNVDEFESWCNGKTGYPIVDAGMRELNSTGFMHNRVRMITASFLTKHLLIDWRWGEAYFAEKLLDFELSSNNGGWQWAAGTGVDAAPYFRVFNPYLQTKRFDPELKYIKKWVPEINTKLYPDAIVDHKYARLRAIEAYKTGIAKY